MDALFHEELDILSTLAYYQALGVPSLTTMELLRYWIPWEKNASPGYWHAGAQVDAPSFYRVIQLVDVLEKNGVLRKKNGYIALPGDNNFFEDRIQAKKAGIEKRRICLRFTRTLPYLPFVRMIALTGSLATDNADEQSDIDILIGSAANRIWTTRILVTGMLQLIGKRRHGARIKNRICLNHYLALDRLPQNTPAQRSFRLLPEALTTAHIYAQALPLWGIGVFHATQTENPWLYSHVSLPLPPALPTISYTPVRSGIVIKNSLEKFLSPLWGLAEKWGGSLQKKHIMRKLAGKSVDPLEVLVGDNTLLFHYPFSRSKYALARYQQRMDEILTKSYPQVTH